MQCLPPPTTVCNTSDLCLQYAQEFAREQGYAIVTERSKYKTITMEFGESTKQLKTAYLACCKGL
jgi:hypothetical protein